MKFTYQSDLPICGLTSKEMNELADINIQSLMSPPSEKLQERANHLIQIKYNFDLYEYENFDFMFFWEFKNPETKKTECKIFYGKSEGEEPTRQIYNKFQHRSWFSDAIYKEWHEAMKPIFEQSINFLGVKEKFIYSPIRSNFTGHNNKQTEWVSFLPTLNPNFEL